MTCWPITAGYVCGTLAPRATIHAIPSTFKPGPHRAACGGVDVRPFSVPVAITDGTNQTGTDGMVVAWPPAIEDRCPDCAKVTKVRGRQRRGGDMWQQYVGDGGAS